MARMSTYYSIVLTLPVCVFEVTNLQSIIIVCLGILMDPQAVNSLLTTG